MKFKGKVVLVTGASSGMGAAAARLFAAKGADVVMVDNDDLIVVAAAECAKVGSMPLTIKADVSKDADAKRVIKKCIDRYQKLDVLINNAGILRHGGVVDGTVMDTYDVLMNVNFRATVYLTTLAVPYLIQTKGCVVNTSSIASKAIGPNLLIYSASKAALTNFTRGVALELAPHGVRVNSVSPGPVCTNLMKNYDFNATWESWLRYTALKKLCTPEEVAGLIAFLASDAAQSITGSDYVIDNGSLLQK